MPLIAVGSLKGAPGVTTTAAVMAHLMDNSMLAEMDPSGGSVAAWFGDRELLKSQSTVLVLSDPQLTSHPIGITRFKVQLPGGQAALVAPQSAWGISEAMTPMACVTETQSHLAGVISAMRSTDQNVNFVVDLGRLSPNSPTWEFATSADFLILVVEESTPAAFTSNMNFDRAVKLGLIDPEKKNVGWVIRHQPKRSKMPWDRFEEATGCDVLCEIPWDPPAVTKLAGGDIDRRWLRSKLVRSVDELVTTVERRMNRKRMGVSA